jgi:hypothetical protein
MCPFQVTLMINVISWKSNESEMCDLFMHVAAEMINDMCNELEHWQQLY